MDITDACRTYVMAALRVIYPGIPNSKMRISYQRSFLSKFFPGIPLSENTVNKHFANLGGNFNVRKAFFAERLKKVPSDHHVVIKKTFIANTDLVDDLLGLTYKPLSYESCGLYIVYAYDLEKSEPICADIFPAKRFDISLCKEFLTTNHIDNGGFFFLDSYLNLKEVEEFRSTFADFPYLINLKRNDSRLITLNLLEMDKFLPKQTNPILYSKTKIDDKTWLYVFKDIAQAGLDESNYVIEAQRNGDFNSEEFNLRKDTFGVLAFESNFDLSPELIYSVYEKREDLNPMFKNTWLCREQINLGQK